MNDIKNLTRFELIRDDIVIAVVEPDMKVANQNKDEKFSISANSSVTAFPMASFESYNSELNAAFMDYSKFDHVRISICSDDGGQYSKMFEGEFLKKTIKFEKDKSGFFLDFQAIHSFFRLSLLDFESEHDFSGVKFKDFISSILTLANIKSKVNIAEGLIDFPIYGLSRNTNAFRLFKEVCLLANAFVRFNIDNTVDIDIRSDSLRRMESSDPIVITDKDIISLEKFDQI